MNKQVTKVFALILAVFALLGAVATTSYAATETTPPIVQVNGEASNVSDTSVTVEAIAFTINDNTEIIGTLENGVLAIVIGMDLGQNDFVALEIIVAAIPPPVSFSTAGLVTAISAESLTIEDVWNAEGESITFILNADTIMPDTPIIGDFVYVDAIIGDDEFLTATFVEVLDDGGQEEYAFYFGDVTALSDGAITIEIAETPMGSNGGSVTLILTADTYIDGTLEVGSEVYAEALIGEDASQTALMVIVLDDGNGNNNYRTVLGVVEAISAESITIVVSDSARTSETFLITNDTFWWTEPQVGDSVMVDAFLNDNQAWVALWIEELGTGGEPTDFFEVIGEVSELTDNGFIVDGETYIATDDTAFENAVEPAVGDTIYAFGVVVAEENILTYVAVGDDNWGGEYFDLDGIVDAISDTQIIVDGTTIIINPDTTIEGNPQVGDEVYVAGMVGNNDELTADYIAAFHDDDEEPSLPWVEAMGTISAYSAETSITVNGVEFAINADTLIEGSPAVDLTAYIFGVVDDNVLGAVMIVVLDEAEIVGIVESLSPSQINVGGTTFDITAETRIVGGVAVGDHVRVGSDVARAAGGNALLIERTPQAPTAVGLNSMTVATPTLLTLLVVTLSGLVLVTSRIWLRNHKQLVLFTRWKVIIPFHYISGIKFPEIVQRIGNSSFYTISSAYIVVMLTNGFTKKNINKQP